MNQDWINGIFGGLLIGASVSVVLYFLGAITGVSGIIYKSTTQKLHTSTWERYFFAGMMLSGLLMFFFFPMTSENSDTLHPLALIAAGLLVGIGTRLGGGCTSGHGVCGMSRLSPRSIIATLTFVLAGVFAVALFRQLGVLP